MKNYSCNELNCFTSIFATHTNIHTENCYAIILTSRKFRIYIQKHILILFQLYVLCNTNFKTEKKNKSPTNSNLNNSFRLLISSIRTKRVSLLHNLYTHYDYNKYNVCVRFVFRCPVIGTQYYVHVWRISLWHTNFLQIQFHFRSFKKPNKTNSNHYSFHITEPLALNSW